MYGAISYVYPGELFGGAGCRVIWIEGLEYVN